MWQGALSHHAQPAHVGSLQSLRGRTEVTTEQTLDLRNVLSKQASGTFSGESRGLYVTLKRRLKNIYMNQL